MIAATAAHLSDYDPLLKKHGRESRLLNLDGRAFPLQTPEFGFRFFRPVLALKRRWTFSPLT